MNDKQLGARWGPWGGHFPGPTQKGYGRGVNGDGVAGCWQVKRSKGGKKNGMLEDKRLLRQGNSQKRSRIVGERPRRTEIVHRCACVQCVTVDTLADDE